ncbi:MAG TPA: hypothetical protein GXZ90_02870 [Clostridiales bacterium]|nr:hypothetical protein [Clostridiales bacterium]
MKITSNLNIAIEITKPVNNKVVSKEITKIAEEIKEEPKDEYISQTIEKKNTYAKPDKAELSRIMEESNKAHENLRQLVKQMLEKQGLTFNDLADGEYIKIDEDTRIKAQEMLDGPMSAENVSDNIVNFAKAISGGDKSKAETLRGAIDKGFAEATKAFGGSLPEISTKTHELIMSKLDAWMSE